MPKLNELLGEVKDNQEHPLYWIKKEIELRVKERLGLITDSEIESILGPCLYSKRKR